MPSANAIAPTSNGNETSWAGAIGWFVAGMCAYFLVKDYERNHDQRMRRAWLERCFVKECDALIEKPSFRVVMQCLNSGFKSARMHLDEGAAHIGGGYRLGQYTSLEADAGGAYRFSWIEMVLALRSRCTPDRWHVMPTGPFFGMMTGQKGNCWRELTEAKTDEEAGLMFSYQSELCLHFRHVFSRLEKLRRLDEAAGGKGELFEMIPPELERLFICLFEVPLRADRIQRTRMRAVYAYLWSNVETCTFDKLLAYLPHEFKARNKLVNAPYEIGKWCGEDDAFVVEQYLRGDDRS